MFDKFIVYIEEMDALKELNDKEFGVFLRAIISFVKTGKVPPLPQKLLFAFRLITAHIERDQKKYMDVCEKRRISGKKGGEATRKKRKSKDASQVPEDFSTPDKYSKDSQKPDTDIYSKDSEKPDTDIYSKDSQKPDTDICSINSEKPDTDICSINSEKTDANNESDTETGSKARLSVLPEGGTETSLFPLSENKDENETYKKQNDSVSNETQKRGIKSNAKTQFEEFWESYPNKKNRRSARREYIGLNPSIEKHKEIMESLERQKKTAQWKAENGRYVPYPSKWLSDRRWEDIIEPPNILNSHSDPFSAESFTVDEFVMAALKKQSLLT